jgi:hypothetical protein
MKRTLFAVIAGALGLTLVLPATAQQSLGEVARELRKDKKAPAAKVYTNENLPTNVAISVTGQVAPPEKPGTAKDKDKDTAVPTEDEIKKAEAAWRTRIAEQKKEISQLERELDVLQRENKLRAATFYADAGNRLRDPAKYAEDDRKYHAEIAAKQTALDAAKQKLDDMRETARKAGIPSSVTD